MYRYARHALLLVTALQPALLQPTTAPSSPATTVVDNTKPRTDTDGNIVNAHQGHMARFQQPDGSWRYYWVGSAWVPCEPAASGVLKGKCVDRQPVHNGPNGPECLESKTNGCLSMTYGACGFNNNNISVYSNAELSNTGWRIETLDAVPRATRPVGEYWQPNFEYNPTTKKYVLWYLYSKPNTTLGNVMVGLADSPAGPFVTVNSNVTLKYKSFTSANLFIDRPSLSPSVPDSDADAASTVAAAPAAYVIYSSFRQPGSINPDNQSFPGTAVVERLNDEWTNTVVPTMSSKQFGAGEGGVMFRWDSPSSSPSSTGDGTVGSGTVVAEAKAAAPLNATTTRYYVLEGMGCCFCPTGSDLYAWSAPHPFGPWERGLQLNTPWPAPPPPPSPPNPVLVVGEIVAEVGGTKRCLTANKSTACIPNNAVMNSPLTDYCAPTYTPCVSSSSGGVVAPEQQWRLTALGEIQSNLTNSSAHNVCLDGAHGGVGQTVYVNWCVPMSDAIGQTWSWDTSGHPGDLLLRAAKSCATPPSSSSAAATVAHGTMQACSAANRKAFSFPPSKPLTPPPPPPGHGCHGCQDNCCVVERHWEMPCQQQGVTPIPQKMSKPYSGCEGGYVLWSGDAWQQAPDDRKEHDPQWWVPLCFNATGHIQSLRGLTQWELE